MGYMDNFDPLEIEKADWDYFRSWGLELSKKIVRYISMDYYFEFNVLKQIIFDGEKGVELDYDPEIRQILGL